MNPATPPPPPDTSERDKEARKEKPVCYALFVFAMKQKSKEKGVYEPRSNTTQHHTTPCHGKAVFPVSKLHFHSQSPSSV